MKVAVIGGGIAGLVAAYELMKAGARPIIIGPSQLGGMIRSSSHAGFTLEQGPNVLVERPEMKQLLAELGLSSAVRYPVVSAYGQYVWWRGSPIKVPSGPREIFANPCLSFPTKLMLPFRFLMPGALKPRGDDLSILEFFTPLIGRQAARDMLDPILKGIYGGDIEELSARSIFSGLWEAATQGASLFGYLRRRMRGGRPSIMVINGGGQRITDRLAERLREGAERLDSRVERIESLPTKGFRLHCSEGSVLDVDACIVTPAGEALLSMVGGLDSELSHLLREQRYASLAVVHMAVPRSEPLIREAFGVLFPAGMPEDLLGVMFNSQLFPHVAPSDKHLLTVIVGGTQVGDRPINQEGLAERLPKLISQLLGISLPECLCITAWHKAIPQLRVGHHKVVAAFDRAESVHPGLVFAGVDRGGIGVSDRVRIAKEAVKRALESVA